MSFDKFEQILQSLSYKNKPIIVFSILNKGFSSEEMVDIKVLMVRNKYFRDNPILKKSTFTHEEEVEIEKFLKRIKHPLLIKHNSALTD